MASTVPPLLPPLTSRPGQLAQPRKRRKRVVKLPNDDGESVEDFNKAIYPDIFAEHWLVESPRRIQFEKTTLGVPSRLGALLEDFYDDVAQIPEKYIVSAKSRTKSFTDFIMPRVTKLGNQIGMKITGWKYAGSTVDDTQVVLPREIDLFILFDKFKMKTDTTEPGYRIAPLTKFHQKEGERPDEFRFGRSEDGSYLSSMAVARNVYDLVERALKLNSQVELHPFQEAQNSTQIIVTAFKNRHTFNLIPATYLEKEEVFLTTRTYAYDENPSSDMLWRVNFMEKERKLFDLMDRADRGVRRKAFKILKALIKVEHTLKGLTSYHVKTVLLHVFDEAVDQSPRWQRDTLETSFMALLRQLLHFLRTKNLPHFFIQGYNLFGNFNPRRLSSLETRVAFLVNNRNELIRILRKRAQ